MLAVFGHPTGKGLVQSQLLRKGGTGEARDGRVVGHAVLCEPDRVRRVRQHARRDDRGQFTSSMLRFRDAVQKPSTLTKMRAIATNAVSALRWVCRTRASRDGHDNDDGDERAQDHVILTGERPQRGRHDDPDGRRNTRLPDVPQPRRDEQSGERDRRRLAEDRRVPRRVGPVTPSARITSRSPIRTRRSCAIDDATDANTHQQAAASTTWPAILDVLVGSSL